MDLQNHQMYVAWRRAAWLFPNVGNESRVTGITSAQLMNTWITRRPCIDRAARTDRTATSQTRERPSTGRHSGR